MTLQPTCCLTILNCEVIESFFCLPNLTQDKRLIHFALSQQRAPTRRCHGHRYHRRIHRMAQVCLWPDITGHLHRLYPGLPTAQQRLSARVCCRLLDESGNASIAPSKIQRPLNRAGTPQTSASGPSPCNRNDSTRFKPARLTVSNGPTVSSQCFSTELRITAGPLAT
jgi:hypothetical protein